MLSLKTVDFSYITIEPLSHLISNPTVSSNVYFMLNIFLIIFKTSIYSRFGLIIQTKAIPNILSAPLFFLNAINSFSCRMTHMLHLFASLRYHLFPLAPTFLIKGSLRLKWIRLTKQEFLKGNTAYFISSPHQEAYKTCPWYF